MMRELPTSARLTGCHRMWIDDAMICAQFVPGSLCGINRSMRHWAPMTVTRWRELLNEFRTDRKNFERIGPKRWGRGRI